jgi:hypothetical protein
VAGVELRVEITVADVVTAIGGIIDTAGGATGGPRAAGVAVMGKSANAVDE